jgi:hypothetical protein
VDTDPLFPNNKLAPHEVSMFLYTSGSLRFGCFLLWKLGACQLRASLLWAMCLWGSSGHTAAGVVDVVMAWVLLLGAMPATTGRGIRRSAACRSSREGRAPRQSCGRRSLLMLHVAGRHYALEAVDRGQYIAEWLARLGTSLNYHVVTLSALLPALLAAFLPAIIDRLATPALPSSPPVPLRS